jgi:hypothetical protein
MKRFLRFLLGCILIPCAWGVCRSFVDVFGWMSGSSGGLFSAEGLSVLAGMVTFLVMWLTLPIPVRMFVLGHELTHAVWGLMFGARVSDLRVRKNGGSVKLTKTNVWITLAPYFFPFWTMTVVLLALLVRCFVSPLPGVCAWLFLISFTWCFHLCFTIRSLGEKQPDIETYGRLFSCVLIVMCNVLGVTVWIVCTTDVSWSMAWASWTDRIVSAYLAAGRVFGMFYECLRSLPFLPR